MSMEEERRAQVSLTTAITIEAIRQATQMIIK
jgi:hypothetical protein